MDLQEIKNINDINGESVEGKLLIATLGMLCCQPGYSSKHPDAVLQEMVKVAEKI